MCRTSIAETVEAVRTKKFYAASHVSHSFTVFFRIKIAIFVHNGFKNRGDANENNNQQLWDYFD